MEVGNTYIDISDEEILNNYRVLLVANDGSLLTQYSIPLTRLKRILNESRDEETLQN